MGKTLEFQSEVAGVEEQLSLTENENSLTTCAMEQSLAILQHMPSDGRATFPFGKST